MTTAEPNGLGATLLRLHFRPNANARIARICNTLQQMPTQRNIMQPAPFYSQLVSCSPIWIFHSICSPFLLRCTPAHLLSHCPIPSNFPLNQKTAEERTYFMPRCQNCNFKWRWKDVIALSLKGKKECPNCQKRQYISPKSNFWVTFFTSMAFVLPTSFLRAYYEMSPLWIFLAIPIYLPLVLLVLPFFYRLSSTRKRFGKTVE